MNSAVRWVLLLGLAGCAAAGCEAAGVEPDVSIPVEAHDGHRVLDVASWLREEPVDLDDGLRHVVVIAEQRQGLSLGSRSIEVQMDLFRNVRSSRDVVSGQDVNLEEVVLGSEDADAVSVEVDPLSGEDVERMRHWLAHTTEVPAVFGTYASLLLHRRLGEPRFASSRRLVASGR